MSRPTSRDELLDRSVNEFGHLMDMVDDLPVDRRLGPSDYPRGSIKDLLAHLDAWHRMFLEWERAGRAGEEAEMPAPGYSWKTTPALNMEIHQRHRDDGWDEIEARVRESHADVRAVIASYSDEELFEKRRYRWTGSTSVGSYAVSATTSHYDWAMKHLSRPMKAWALED